MSSHHIPPPTPSDIYRYRYHHSVNLGGVFILQQWMFPSMFDSGVTGPGEIDAVVASLTVHGLEITKERWERHWNDALSEEELEWLVKRAGGNCVRVSVGYWTMGIGFVKNTRFAMGVGEVYGGAWERVKRLCERCKGWGVGVLLDFQGVTGGVDGESGQSVGKEGLWEEGFDLGLAMRCLVFMAREVNECEELRSVVGIQICNVPGMYEWYEEVVGKMSEVDPALPLYIHDGWDLEKALSWSMKQNDFPGKVRCPVIMDTHRYYAFDEAHKRMSPKKVIAEIKNELRELDEDMVGSVYDCKGAVAAYIGEYSCAMSAETCVDISQDELDDLTIQFGSAQNHRWQEKANGSAFWTFKMEGANNPTWSFREQVENGTIQPPPHSLLTVGEIKSKLAQADQKRGRLMASAMEKHISYFARIGGKYEHWRYADG